MTNKFKKKHRDIEEVFELTPQVFSDSRGFFLESYSLREFNHLGIELDFVQDNQSHSKKNVLRGLHYQLKNPQGKLVRCLSGSIFDVAVDIRFGSPTFGRAEWIILDDKNKKQFWIPPGFAHGFCVLSDEADFFYKCTDYYYPDDEYSINWNDPSFKIPWPIKDPKISDKDRESSNLDSVDIEHLPKYEK